MVARDIYLRVAELLRAHHAPVIGDHRHSGLAFSLRAGVLDSELRYQAGLAYMQSWAAVHGSPAADLKAAVGMLKRLLGNALGEVPYLTGGRTGENLVEDERMAAIQRYRDYRARTLRDAADHVPPPKAVKPVEAKKHQLFGPGRSAQPRDPDRPAKQAPPQFLFANVGLSPKE